MKRLIKRLMFGIFSLLAFLLLLLHILSVGAGARITREYAEILSDGVQEVVIDDVAISYREAGETNAKVLVIVHGFLGSAYDFREVIPLLAETYHVYALDLPGFGLSDKPAAYDYAKANQAETVRAFVQELELTAFALLGHSMGGEIAIRYALDYPESVSELILVASAGMASGTAPALPGFLYGLVVKNYFAQQAGLYSAYYQDEMKTRDNIEPMYYLNSRIPNEVFRQFSLDQDDDTLRERIPDIQVPTLLIWGRHDTWIPLSQGEAMAALIAGSTLSIIENASHLPFQEDVETFVALVAAFIE